MKLRSTQDLVDFVIQATDGPIGHVKDFYFDDESWVVRYLVVETGTWLSSLKVLISPIAIGSPDWAEKRLPIAITTEQVRNCPPIDTDKPVTRQHEMQYLGYYGYPYYWRAFGTWGQGIYPGAMVARAAQEAGEAEGSMEEASPDRGSGADEDLGAAVQLEDGDPHLRSCRSVTGYHIQATDGSIGHVQGFLLDEDTWAIHDLIVDTSNWWLGQSVLIPAQRIRSMRWSDFTVCVDLTLQAVQEAPPYDPAAALDRAREANVQERPERAGTE